MPSIRPHKNSVYQNLSRWMRTGILKVSFVGEAPELIAALHNLKKFRGYEALENLLNRLIHKENDGTVWEEIEHAFAVAKEAHNFSKQGFEVELEKTLGEKDQKKPDLRLELNGKWVYVEVKISSMFPGERIFLDKTLNVFVNRVNELQLPYKVLLVLRYEESQMTKKMSMLLTELETLSRKLSSIRKKDIRSAYMLLNNEAVLLMVRHPSPTNIRTLLSRYTDLIDFINLSMISQMLKKRRRFFLAIDAIIPKKGGDIFETIENEGIFIGRLSSEMERERIARILRDALRKISKTAPYIVTIYSREVILKSITPEIINDIISQKRFQEISGLILDVGSAASPPQRSLHKRSFYENPEPLVKLDSQTKQAIELTLK